MGSSGPGHVETYRPKVADVLDSAGRGRLFLIIGIPLSAVLVLAAVGIVSGFPVASRPSAGETSGVLAPGTSATTADESPVVGSKPESASSGPAAGGARNRTEQASAISDMLQRTHTSRQQVQDAVADVLTCGANRGLDADARTLADAADNREQLANTASALPVDALPAGSRLLDLLASALRDSAQADRELAGWAQDLRDGACRPNQAVNNKHYRTSASLSRKAEEDKQSLLVEWNPLATREGLPTWKPADL
ncbi:hypothetical protein [Amycolatopsis sp. cmx-4-61]|uniref:hypothetical protein n=1 Tax=Amycolatopsis sp. cmx-4-61 TaxID=2790937 RepID=UPI00397DE79D